jgi:hypothetical protein
MLPQIRKIPVVVGREIYFNAFSRLANIHSSYIAGEIMHRHILLQWNDSDRPKPKFAPFYNPKCIRFPPFEVKQEIAARFFPNWKQRGECNWEMLHSSCSNIEMRQWMGRNTYTYIRPAAKKIDLFFNVYFFLRTLVLDDGWSRSKHQFVPNQLWPGTLERGKIISTSAIIFLVPAYFFSPSISASHNESSWRTHKTWMGRGERASKSGWTDNIAKSFLQKLFLANILDHNRPYMR